MNVDLNMHFTGTQTFRHMMSTDSGVTNTFSEQVNLSIQILEYVHIWIQCI